MGDGELLQRFTPPAIRVVQYTKEEARRSRGKTVTSEHILLALIREQEGVAARVLERLGVSLGRVQNEMRKQRQQLQPQTEGKGSRSWSMEARRVLELAIDEARELNPKLGLPNFVDTEHLLLALLREQDNGASQILQSLGVDLDQIPQEVLKLLGVGLKRRISAKQTKEEQNDTYAVWLSRALHLGAADAKIISPSSVVTAPWVRLKCQYGCGGWGQRLTCPPHSPTPEQTRAVLDCYRTAILVHCPGDGPSESQRGNWHPIKQIVTDLEREVFLAGYYKAFAFGSGPCNLCEECNLESCLHPHQARPAMEAAGIDVFATARNNGFTIEVVRDHDCPQNYYGLVLVE